MEEVRLTKEEIETLVDVAEDWKSKTSTEKKTTRDMLVEKFLTARNKPIDKWSKTCMKTKISNWISNHVTSRANHVPKLLKMTWSGRDVFNEEESARIQTQIDKLKGQGFHHIAAVNKARAELWDELSSEKQQEYEDTAEQWTMEGPAPIMRKQVIAKRVPDWVSAFCALLWDQADVMAYVSYVWQDSDDKIKHARYDISLAWHDDQPETVRFTEAQPNWKKDFPDSFKAYCHQMLATPDDESSTRQPARQATIRKLFSAHYARACGKKDIAVPWKVVFTNKHNFFAADIIPDDIVIQDPSHMGQTPLENLWNHIHQLQDCEDPEEQFQFSQYLQGTTWLPAQYDAEPVVRQKPNRKRPKTARGPPAASRRAADDGREGDDEAEGVDGDEQHGTRGGRKSKGKRPEKSRGSKPGGDKVQVPGPGTSHKGKGNGRPGTGRSGSDPRRAHGEGQSKGKGRQMDDRSDTSVTSYEEESASSREFEVEHINIDVVSEDSDAAPNPSIARKPAPRPVALQERVQGVVPVIPPQARLVQEATEKPPAWVGHVPECVFPFLWALSPEQAWRDLLTSWKHMLGRRATLSSGTVPNQEWAHWDYPDVAIPEKIHSSDHAWGNLIEWIEVNVPVEQTARQEVQRWFLATGMVIRDTRCANDTEPDDEQPVPYSGPLYMRWSRADLSLIKDRVLPAIEHAYYPVLDQHGDQIMLDPALFSGQQAGPSNSGILANARSRSTKEGVAKDGQGAASRAEKDGELASAAPSRPPRPSTSGEGGRGPAGIRAQELPQDGVSGRESEVNSTRASVRGPRGHPPGVPALNLPQNSTSADEVEREVVGMGGDVGSISEALAASGSRKKRNLGTPYVLVPSSAVAQNTRGRVRAKQPVGQVPEGPVPEGPVPAGPVPAAHAPPADVIMEDAVAEQSGQPAPARKSTRAKKLPQKFRN
ncbi:hypothetical protein LXA43DRAFT_1095995 [Ganoderma leucocontextum]|nr:hypothetical protein LXA43DRAFT_1095995 [Ganoderma leucocontextum]